MVAVNLPLQRLLVQLESQLLQIQGSGKYDTVCCARFGHQHRPLGALFSLKKPVGKNALASWNHS